MLRAPRESAILANLPDVGQYRPIGPTGLEPMTLNSLAVLWQAHSDLPTDLHATEGLMTETADPLRVVLELDLVQRQESLR